MILSRYIKKPVTNDLKRKMVFISGPRQVGKTTFSLTFLKKGTEKHPAYFNWDSWSDRRKLMKEELPVRQSLLIFDEIHKYSRWRNFLKGLYDKQKSSRRFLITGSGSLSHYSRGGDSLQGRYYSYRLHPFSLRELNKKASKSDLMELLNLSGFPEPLFSGSKTVLRRWTQNQVVQVLREEIRNLERVKEIDILEVLVSILPDRVGSPLSIKNLREDLEVSHETADRWIRILENLFFCFRISPFGSSNLRTVKKEKKLYLYNWTQVQNEGLVFENLTACQLLKYCHFIEDTEGFKMELRFLRDVNKREIDFVVLKNKKALFAVECKTGDSQLSPSIRYFKERMNIPKFYQVHLKTKDYEKEGVRVCPFETFCKELNMP